MSPFTVFVEHARVYIEGIPAFLILLMVLVAAHEYGHYIFARLFNMGVEEFAIGMFGKQPLVRWMRRTYRVRLKPGEAEVAQEMRADQGGFSFEGGGENRPVVVRDTPGGQVLEEYTDFTIRPWPIGGFVRIKGMVPHDDGSETRIPGGFYSKPPWQRFIVLLAGPVFSVLAGVIAMIPMFMINGEMRSSNLPVLGPVMEKKAADLAGLKEGDVITAIDGQPITTFYQIMQKVQASPGIPLQFTYREGAVTKNTVVTPYMSPEPLEIDGPDLESTGEVARAGMMGVARKRGLVRLSLGEATVAALRVPVQDLVGLFSIAKHPSLTKDSVGGPITMIEVTSDAVQDGFSDVVMVAALISISVGIFNLLPIFPLDGGQMMVAVAEMLRGGRRLSMQLQGLVGTVGTALVIIMVVFVLSIDLTRPFSEKQPPPVYKPSPKAATAK